MHCRRRTQGGGPWIQRDARRPGKDPRGSEGRPGGRVGRDVSLPRRAQRHPQQERHKPEELHHVHHGVPLQRVRQGHPPVWHLPGGAPPRRRRCREERGLGEDVQLLQRQGGVDFVGRSPEGIEG